MELDYEFFRVEDYSLIPDSGGRGKFRGGLGFQKAYRILKDGVTFATYGDRFRVAPEGLFGGAAGRHAETLLERDGKTRRIDSKISLDLKRGDLLIMRTGGGGGYGLPDERTAARQQRDLAQGLMTEAAAE